MTTASRQGPPGHDQTRTDAAVPAAELLTRAQHQKTLLIDVRSRRAYNHAHVPGSHSIPAGLLLASEPPEGDLLLIGVDSQDSEKLIEELHSQGYSKQLQYLEGGFNAWVSGTSPAPAQVPLWKQALVTAQQRVAGPLLLITAGATQSVGLLAVGFVLLVTPWTLRRSRA